MSMFTRVVMDEIKKRRRRENPLLGYDGERTLNKILLFWWASGLVFAYSVNAIGISVSSCNFCEHIASIIPSIYNLSTGTRYPNAMFYVAHYYLFSSPLVFALLVMKVTIKYPEKRLKSEYNFMFYCLSLLLALYLSIFLNVEIGGADAIGKLGKMYRDILFVAASASYSFFCLLMSMLFFIYTHLTVLFENK